jgi:hypothetical protein
MLGYFCVIENMGLQRTGNPETFMIRASLLRYK